MKKELQIIEQRIKTPRGSFRVTISTEEELKSLGYRYHHSSEDNLFAIYGNGEKAYAKEMTKLGGIN